MTDKVTKFINSLSTDLKRKLKEKLLLLKTNPYGMKDVKKLQTPENNLYRLRLGKIRIIYKLTDQEIEIVDIDYRGNIY